MKRSIIRNVDKKQIELDKIKQLTIDMFNQVQKMLELSKILIENPNNELAMELVDEDTFVDDLEKDLILEINNFIVLYQPKASDLRQVLGTYRIISDLERVGDNVKSFSKTLIKNNITRDKHEELIANILDQILTRIKETKEAYDKTDHSLAKMIAKRDTEIDTLTKDLITDISKRLRSENNAEDIKTLTKLIVLAKFFERSGDHLVSICEQVSYIQKGQLYNYS